ncbi:hypothetical protein [Chamaesiphon sp. VAR_69_metabat_338]|uniref:hypothetical protein n=1 Tax=Chamaesiphon sp. VAR_69_metabat_338 TaxID=2964704 RepID=UPI00286E03BC|nr:hypothetical protein [Chamaesiphon sp. VAR_69_metabat_338]
MRFAGGDRSPAFTASRSGLKEVKIYSQVSDLTKLITAFVSIYTHQAQPNEDEWFGVDREILNFVEENVKILPTSVQFH